LISITLNINGEVRKCDVEPAEYLAQVIREKLGVTGTKRGCDTGGCGMCTVLLDGKPIYSCMTPAWKAEGKKITTVEGISQVPDILDPLQKAMIDNFAFQCGYCTGAMILVGKSLLEKNPHPTEEDVRKAMCGVLCRCTNYEGYIDAIIETSRAKS
jgi:aerobic-type carbon monoxide dehydrogenase small subunit (CoxS/CutS family)